MDEELYSIEEDSNGKLKDLSNSDNKENAPDYLLEGETVYIYNLKEYTYAIRNPQSQNPNETISWDALDALNIWEKEWPDFYSYGVPAEKSGILVDSNGYCLFSWTLLKEYGIGFILSDWIEKNSGNPKLKIKFNSNYFPNWYNNTTFSQTELTVDDIYSSQILANYIEDFKNKTSCSVTGLADTENIVRQLYAEGPIWTYDSQKLNVSYPDKLDKSLFFKVMATRFYPGTNLLGIKYENDTYKDVIVNITPPTTTGGTFISLNINPYQYGDTYGAHFHKHFDDVFVRYQITSEEISSLNAALSSANKVWTLGKWIATTDTVNTNEPVYELWTICKPYISSPDYPYSPTPSPTEYVQNPKPFPLPNNPSEHQDYYAIKKVFVDGQPVVKTKKTVRLKSMLSDISPLNTNNISLWTDVTYTSTTTSEIDETIVVNTPASKILDEAFSEENLAKYQTPAEYYGGNTSTDDANIENAYEKTNITRKTWFWLDTIKNWCMYTMNADGILYLGAWDGLGNWDRMEWIMSSIYYPNYLASQFLYIPDFFKHGYKYLDPWCATTQIRYPDGQIARMYYNYMVLNHETIVKNYSEKFQTKHDTIIKWNYERSELSNTGLGDKTTADGWEIYVNESIKGVQEVDTQYCPTVLRLMDGNIGLVYTILIEKTGWDEEDIYSKFLINADKANDKCKEIFGAGDDKTIEKDWKRYFNNDTSQETASTLSNNKLASITGAPNLTPIKNNQINKINLVANRPNPTTNNLPGDDFVERWK